MAIFLYMYALDVPSFCEHKERGLRVRARVLSQVLEHLPVFQSIHDNTRAAMHIAYNSEFCAVFKHVDSGTAACTHPFSRRHINWTGQLLL
eukprot:1142659-Pleurochrysis_carterae.AAC.3